MTEPTRVEIDGVDITDYLATAELPADRRGIVTAVPQPAEPFNIDDLRRFMESVLDDRQYRLEPWQTLVLNRMYDQSEVREGADAQLVGLPPTPDETVHRIDETLTYYSAGLGCDVEVPVNSHPESPPVVPLPTVDLPAFMTRLAAEFDRAREALFRGLGASLAQLAEAFEKYFAAELEAEARRQRLRRIRHMYRVRRKGKW